MVNEIGKLFRRHNIIEFKSPEDLRGEDSMCQALLEIMKPEIDEIRRSEAQKGQVYGAVTMGRDLGLPDEEILKRLQERYHLSWEDAEKYLQADLT